MKKKLAIAAALIAVCVLLLTACGDANISGSGSLEAKYKADGFTVTVTTANKEDTQFPGVWKDGVVDGETVGKGLFEGLIAEKGNVTAYVIKFNHGHNKKLDAEGKPIPKGFSGYELKAETYAQEFENLVKAGVEAKDGQIKLRNIKGDSGKKAGDCLTDKDCDKTWASYVCVVLWTDADAAVVDAEMDAAMKIFNDFAFKA